MTTHGSQEGPLPSPFSLCHSEESQHWAYGLYLQPKNSLFSPQSGSGNTTVSSDLQTVFLRVCCSTLPSSHAGPSHLGHSARITDTSPNPRGCWSSWPPASTRAPSCFALGLPSHSCSQLTLALSILNRMTSYVFFLPKFLHLHSHKRGHH